MFFCLGPGVELNYFLFLISGNFPIVLASPVVWIVMPLIGLRDRVAAIVAPSPAPRLVIENCLFRSSLTPHQSSQRAVSSNSIVVTQSTFSCVPSSGSIVYSICDESTDLSVADCAAEFMWCNLRKCIAQLILPFAHVRPATTEASDQQKGWCPKVRVVRSRKYSGYTWVRKPGKKFGPPPPKKKLFWDATLKFMTTVDGVEVECTKVEKEASPESGADGVVDE